MEIKGLTVKYPKKRSTPEVTALDNFSVNFLKNGINVLLGPSGCGKSTLLKTICGLLECEGDILVNGVDITTIHPSDRNFSLVDQNFNLYPHLTIFDNIAFPLKVRGVNKQEIITRVREVSESLDIAYLLSRKPKELSIGQQQRVALARAMVKKPNIYLFDEPLSNLDDENKAIEKEIIKKSIKEIGACAIYVTHNVKEALSIADRIFVMDQGKLVFEGTPDELLTSKEPFIAQFRESL